MFLRVTVCDFFVFFKEAVHRYYELRRRIYNDSKPERRGKVEEHKQKDKKRQSQLRVNDSVLFESVLMR